MYQKIMYIVLGTMLFSACEILDSNTEPQSQSKKEPIYMDDVAKLFSQLPISSAQMGEVRDAVRSSSGNGYDEEYTMKDLFSMPGKGVGEPRTKAVATYNYPLRDMIRQHIVQTKSVSGLEFTESFLESLMDSDYQIYWPYSEIWDGKTLPIITFDPEDDTDENIGYQLICTSSGYQAQEVTVDEKMAQTHPVWVINRNSDSSYMTAEVIRRDHPEWEEGGSIVIKPSMTCDTKAPKKRSRSLIMRDFTMLRHYDCWFAGASEFFVKIGAIEDFTAVTEAEMKLYSPFVTDMLVVVKRKDLGKAIALNTVMVSDYSEQMTRCAFMITEDDGGTQKSWKCTAFVRVASKSYGIELSLPLNEWDDIVWRGQLDQNYLMAHNNMPGRFGDVQITFAIEEY